ncbi:MAG: hypothetical protein NC401_15780 [Ruminococcus sp.]|nr:hypothetical protein [Ruminococcus sp.]
MELQDKIILAVNVICLIGSIIGAAKSYTNYKKCKQLSTYANLRTALDECQNIQNLINRKLLKLCGKDNIRGVNPKIEIIECGESIKNSLSKIKEILPSYYHIEIDKLLSDTESGQFNTEKYVASLISGSALNNQTVTDDNVYHLQKAIEDVQICIKKIMESIQDGEKKM